MATLNTIRTVSVRYQSEGADRFRSDADAAAASQTNLAQATERAATVTEQSARRQLSAASAYDRVRASVDANYRSQIAMERATRTVDRAMQQGVIDGAAYERTLAQIQARFATTTTAADRMAAAWRNLGAAGEANSRLLTPAGRLGGLSSDGSVQFRPGMGPVANQNIAGRRLRSDEITNLTYQGGDIVAQIGSGSPLSMIALQQGPQIAQVFAGPGGASVKGAFSQAAEAAMGLASRVGIVGGAIGGLAVAVGVGVASLVSFRAGQTEIEKILAGVGRTSGATVSQINALADAQARVGGMSRGAARDIASIYASTGRVEAGVLAGAVAATPDFAKLLGTDQKSAAEQLAGALSDVSRGAGDLAQRYGLLNDATAESVRRLDAQGDRLGAQRLLLAAVRDSTRGLAEESRGWSLVVQTLASNWDRLGQALDRFATGGGVETRIVDLQRVLESQSDNYLPDFLQRFSTRPALQAELDRLLERQRVARQQTEQAQAAQRSAEVGAIVRGLSPAEEALQRLEDGAQKIRSNLSRLPLDEQRTAQNALDGMVRSSEVLRENLKAGGDQFAASLKQAQFDSSTVGFTDRGRSAAQIEFEFKSRAEQAVRDGTASEQNARLQTLELERTTRLQTLDRQSSLDLNQSGGAFSRASASLQAQILEASRRFPTVDAAMLAGVLEKEGGFWNTGPTRVLGRDGRPATTAWGRGQITDAAEKDIRRLPGMENFDKYNVDTQVMGAAAYLSQRLQWVNGDKIKALDGYGTGPGYGLDVMRRAGQLGDTSSLALARDQDANNRAVQQANDNLKNITENYGRNAVALEANGRAQDQYRQLIERGVPAATAASIAFDGMQTKIASLGQTARFIQFQRDDIFARQQLGRTQIEQQAFAAARPYAGTEFESRVRDQALDTAQLYESKIAVTDAMGGFVTDLRRGTDAANAFGNMLGRLADRAINGLTDTLVSGLFSAGTKGSGFLSGIGSLFGFANGGVMTSGGPLPLRAYSAGGIADSPQLALYGEGRMPEAYVPLPDGRRIPVAMQGGGAANSSAVTDARSFSFDMRGSTLTEQQARAMFMDALAQSEAKQSAALPGRMRDIQRRAA